MSRRHADEQMIDDVCAWMTEIAGLPVLLDQARAEPDSHRAETLQRGIAQARSMLIVLSRASVQSGWAAHEYAAAMRERSASPGFRIVPIRLPDAEVPPFLRATRCVELTGGELGARQVGELIAGLYDSGPDARPGNARDVFVSRPWREDEAPHVDAVCRLVSAYGFRLIGDYKEQHGFGDGQRVRSIIASCGAFVGIVPDRVAEATSERILHVIELARELGLPSLLVAGHAVQLPQPPGTDVIRLGPELSARELSTLQAGVERLDEEWVWPRASHEIFFSASLRPGDRERNRNVQRILERVTAMPCVIGDEIREGYVQGAIVEAIRGAFLVVADISGDNLNTCIEAGIALGAGRTLHLLAKGPRGRPAFMFRDQQVWHFDDDTQLLGLAHRIGRPYRRRVLNDELGL